MTAKIKKILSVALVLFMVFTSAPLQGLVGLELPSLFSTKASAADLAATGKCGDNVTYTYNSKTGEVVISGTGEMYGYNNEDSPFYDSDIKSVVIENGVTSIGDYVFYECESLTSISIPNSVTSIGERVFFWCRNLKNITIPDSVISIGDNAFFRTAWYDVQPDGDVYIGKVYYKYKGEMPKNTVITIKDGTRAIADYAFESCSGLISVTISNSLINIGDSAFYGCYSLTSVTIPDSVESIGCYVFENCSSLTSITIPDSVTNIGGYTFDSCNNLTDITVDINNKNYSSDEYGVLFNKDKSVLIRYPIGNSRISYKIPGSVKAIGDGAFCECYSLTSITIPDSVTSIGEKVFYSCLSLTNIKIPESVTSIGDRTFTFCKSLTSIIIPNSVISIGTSAFDYCINLKSITIPNSVTSIGSRAFVCCYSLTSATIPDSVISIGGEAFASCVSLTNITIPESVISIGNYAFSACKGLTNVTIPDSVTSIGDSAFSYCDSLKSVTIPDSVISIGCDAFDGTAWYNDQSDGDVYIGKFYYAYKGEMPKNTSIVIKNGTKSIADGAFFGCDTLISVTIPNSVTSIGDEVFRHCRSLINVIMPDSVKSVGRNAFYDCTGLISVIIPDSLETIGEGAFYRCSSLTSITIPNSVKTISNHAFGNCNSLTSVTIPDSVKIIGEYAFYNCDTIKDIYYTGTSSQWENIEIEKYNECLTNATIHYNYSPSSLVLGKTSKITATQTTSAVTLKWNAVPNATGYKIYQKTAKGWQSLGNVTGTSKTVSGLTAGTKYTFAVKAGAVVGGKTIWSDVYTTINTATKAVKPVKVTSAQNDNAIKLTWTKCAGATGYRIYYRTSTKAAWKVGKSSTTATSHTFSGLKPNQAFQFAVRPYTIVDGVVIWSDYTTITASTTPAVPVAKVISPSKGKVTLTWNAVSGATGYQVYYKSGNGSWKLYKTTSKPATYNFTGLKSGTKYTFAVRAYRTVSGTNFTSGYKAVSVTVK